MDSEQNNSLDMDVVYLGGRLDCNNASDLEEALNNLISSLRIRLIFNCKDLDSIDSSGIKTILSALQKVREMKGDIRFACVKPEVKDSINTDEVALMTFFDTEDAAIRSYL